MNPYTTLARQAIDNFITTGNVLKVSPDLPSELLANKAGVFVSIYKNFPKATDKEELRGCIGTYLPTKDNIAQEIIDNAISACAHDYRFTPVTKDELKDLIISVDVLSIPEKIDDISLLNPLEYGVIAEAKNDARIGILLPNLPTVTTIHDQIAIVLNKAKLTPKDEIQFSRFKVTRYK